SFFTSVISTLPKSLLDSVSPLSTASADMNHLVAQLEQFKQFNCLKSSQAAVVPSSKKAPLPDNYLLRLSNLNLFALQAISSRFPSGSRKLMDRLPATTKVSG